MGNNQYEKRSEIYKGLEILINTCGQVKKGEKVLILADESTNELSNFLLDVAKKVTPNIKLMLAPKEKMHGIEPPEIIAEEMLKSDVVFGITTFSLAHTKARSNASKNGTRYLSLPDYNENLLSRNSLKVNFFEQAKLAKRLKNLLDKSQTIKVLTNKGTDITLDITGRTANYCPGFCDKPGMLGSPPDIETNISPIENKSNGIIVVDGSIPCKELGLINEKIKLVLENGIIKKIDTYTKQGRILKNIFGQDQKTKVLAEFGIGMNPKAELCGIMLEDEGCLGTVHFGFGSNSMIGGKNHVNFHLDLVICKPTIFFDKIKVMEEGVLQV